MIGRSGLLLIELETPGSPVRRVDQNRFASPHVEPNARHATTGKAARNHAAFAGHGNFEVAILGRKLDGQPSASGIVVKHARGIESGCRASFDL
jgi:hypothetical protein